MRTGPLRLARRHPRAWDITLAAVLAALVLQEVLASDQDVPLGLAVPVALLMTVPFAWRRRHPVPVALTVLTAFTVQGVAGDWALEPQTELLAAAMAFWGLGAHARDPAALRAAAAGLLAVVLHEPGDTIVQGPLMAGVFAGGRLMRSRSELATALERDRAQAEEQAVAAERARIARELHDVVAHSISLMTVQAGGERLALGEQRPETAQTLREIEVTGRQALGEMRRLLGMLRDSENEVELAPQPGIAQLPALVERVGRAGLHVDLAVEGEPTAVSPGVDISVYRITQEALTNVLKHGDARRASVRVVYADESVEIEVVDDGTATSPAQDGGGHGLSGMRERAGLYGGTVEAGPLPHGGWSLRARLPREPAA